MAMAVAFKSLQADEREARATGLATLAEIERPTAELHDEAAKLERKLPRLRAEVAELTQLGNEADLRISELEAEDFHISEREAEVEQRLRELRRRAASDTDLVDLLRDLGEARVERAARQLGWVEEPHAVGI